LRALLVSHTGGLGGPTSIVLALLRDRPDGVESLCVFLDDGPAVAAARAAGTEAVVLRAGRARDVWRVPAVVVALARLARRRRADVVFSHTSKAHAYGGIAAALLRLPSLWFQYEAPGLGAGLPGMGAKLQELAARLPADAVVLPSDAVADAHRRRWPRAHVHRVHPGVAAAGTSPRAHHRTGDIDVVVVGRLLRWRRVDLALRAMRGVLAAEPRARLTVIGDARPDVDADHPAELRALADELGIAHAVTFAGAVDEWREAIAQADVLLHTSEGEPFSVVLVEALVRGVPVIAPPSGGAGEIVRHDVDGLLVEPTDTAALTRAVLELARAPERRAAMGAAGRQRALEHFDEGRMTGELWRLVDDLVRREREAPRGDAGDAVR
jgi:glycosyltransferase involved in cell wall biosynthesis